MKYLYSALIIIAGSLGFAAAASAQAYYPYQPTPAYGQISWGPAIPAQPYGVPIGGYNYPYQTWRPSISPQPQGICVTCAGWTAPGYNGGWNTSFSSFALPYGYYPNGYAFRFQDRRVVTHDDDRWVRNRVQTGVFMPF
jgi:hypothetical protein